MTTDVTSSESKSPLGWRQVVLDLAGWSALPILVLLDLTFIMDQALSHPDYALVYRLFAGFIAICVVLLATAHVVVRMSGDVKK
jgi:hypothetical protein